jgi:hypothetical protein
LKSSIAFPIRVRYKNLGLWEWGMGNGELGIEKNILLVLKRIFFLKNNSNIPYSLFPIPEQKKCPSLYLISQRNAIFRN